MLTPEEKDAVCNRASSGSEIYRPLLGTEEFIDGKRRSCLWIADDEVEESATIKFIKTGFRQLENTVRRVIVKRLNGSRTRSHRFGEIRHKMAFQF